MDCGCIENGSGLKVRFCRTCAAGLTQRTAEWYQARSGLVTGSCARHIVFKKQNGDPTAKYGQYMDQLLAERLTGVPQIRSVPSLDWRANAEPEARAAYAFERDVEVFEAGLIYHPFIELFACSPDGLVGDRGMVEIKKLDVAQHVKLWEGGDRAKSVLDEYMPQVNAGLACTSREWCDFVSYCPEMIDPDLRLFVKTYQRNEEEISRLECAVRDFLAELEDKVAAIKNRGRRGQDEALAAQLAGSIAMLQPDSVVIPIKRKRKVAKHGG